MCVAFCAAQVIKMSPPNEGNPHSTEDIDATADAIYVATTGSSTASIPIDIPQFHEILSSHGVKFETIGFDTASIDAALSEGCPVVIMGHEYSFINMDASSPYDWNTADIDHAVILSGQSSDNGYEVRDSANSGGNPAIYNKWAMSLFSATKIVPAWIGGNMIPRGWDDDGTTLTASNGHKVVLGFRSYILNNQWDPNNVPLEEEHGVDPIEDYHQQTPSGGSRQTFLYSRLGYTTKRGVYPMGIGVELLGATVDRDRARADLAEVRKQIAAQSDDDSIAANVRALFAIFDKLKAAVGA